MHLFFVNLNPLQVDSSSKLLIVSIAQANACRANITVRAVDSGRPPLSREKTLSFLLQRSLGDVRLTAREVLVSKAKDAQIGDLSFVRGGQAVAGATFS